jgi:hypothetical protein
MQVWRVSYKRQELLTLREHMGSSPVVGVVRVAHPFGFVGCVLSCACVLCVSCQCLWIVHSLFSTFNYENIIRINLPPSSND